jgi:hypothetical protein
MRRIVVLLLIAALATAACAGDSGERLEDLEARITDNEQRIADLEADAASGVATVVLYTNRCDLGVHPSAHRWCVTYLIAGTERTLRYDSELSPCFLEARIGEALPEPCR